MNRHSEAYLDALPLITAAIDHHECAFFFSNPLFLLSRLECAVGWSVERRAHALEVHASDEWCTVLPLSSDRDAYAQAIVDALALGKPVLRVPLWMATHAAAEGGAALRAMWREYICRTAPLRTMAGRKLKGIRQRLSKLDARSDLQIVELGAEHQAEAGALARLWYGQREPFLKTMYLLEESVWLFENWATVSAAVEGAFGLGVVHDGKLVAANLSAPLSASQWVCHTERYDRDCPLYANQWAFREACRRVDADRYPFINEGATEKHHEPGVDDLTTFKRRISSFTRTPLMFQMPES